MNGAIESLFCSNPDLSHQIYTYCKANPEFMEAEAEYDALLQSLEQTLGYALGLRQEVLWALGRE